MERVQEVALLKAEKLQALDTKKQLEEEMIAVGSKLEGMEQVGSPSRGGKGNGAGRWAMEKREWVACIRSQFLSFYHSLERDIKCASD